jgi:hypothetical protein
MSSAAFNPCHVGNQFCWNEKLRAVGRGRKSDVVNLLLDGWEANNACGPDVVTIHHNEQTLLWISKSCYSKAFILDQRAHHLRCQTLTSTHHCSLHRQTDAADSFSQIVLLWKFAIPYTLKSCSCQTVEGLFLLTFPLNVSILLCDIFVLAGACNAKISSHAGIKNLGKLQATRIFCRCPWKSNLVIKNHHRIS